MIWPNSDPETRRKAGLGAVGAVGKKTVQDQGEMFPEVKNPRGFNKPNIAPMLKLMREQLEKKQ